MTATGGASAADGNSAKVVVITGSGAIGLACAYKLNSADLELVLADVSEERLAMASGSLGSQGVHSVVCDVADPASTQSLAESVAAIGRLKTIVHTAGVSGTLCDVETIYQVNLRGALNVLDSFESLVTDGTSGIFLASIGGHQHFTSELDPLLIAADPLPHLRTLGAFDVTRSAAYGIAKRTVMLHCRQRSKTWGLRGGRLISISPGLIEDTPMGAASLEHGPGRPYATWSALGRNGKAHEVANLVAFLSSEDASFITGCDILVDGGLLAGIDYHLAFEDRLRWHACLYPSPR